MEEEGDRKRTRLFLEKAAMIYRDACPEEARFLMQRHQMDAPALPKSVLCPFCHEWRRPGEYHVRLRPKPRPSLRVIKLIRMKAAHKRLSVEQTKVLQRFRRASSALMATCHTCNKTSRQVGVNREFLMCSRTYSTPGSMGKHRTPQSANRPTPKSDKTPNRTPVSRSSESSSASKSASGKKSAFSRLKKLLTLEDSQKSKKGGLKDFLSSL